MIKLLLVILLFCNSLLAQKNITAYVGEKFSTSYQLNFTNLESLSVELEISNPTLIYPEFILVGSDTAVFEKMNKTIYLVNDIKINKDDSLIITIYGEILAGNDSVAFADVIFNINNNFDIQSRINFSIKNIAPLPYIRFPKILNIYPNPAFLNEEISIQFQIDTDAVITVSIYALDGKLVEIVDSGLYEKGENLISFNIESINSAGFYLLELKADNFKIMEKMIFIK